MDFYQKNKWFILSLTGILTFSLGLCIFGEAIILKNKGEPWFLFGTIALMLINFGVCLMISANTVNR